MPVNQSYPFDPGESQHAPTGQPTRPSAPIDHVLESLDAVKRSRTGWVARCPAHEDNAPSLSINEGDDGRVLLNCFAGCSPAAICESIGLQLGDLFVRDVGDDRPSRPLANATGERITYDFHDAAGTLTYQEVRDPPKRFWLRRPDGRGGWTKGLDGVQRELYRLPELLAEPDRWVALVEGCKDADRLRNLGIVATTVAGGAKAPWIDRFSETLAGRAVVVLADNDPPGITCAYARAQALHGIASTVKMIELSDLPAKADISDWLDLGHTRDELLAIIRDTPPWTPETAPADDDPKPSRQAVVQSLADIDAKPIDWYWRGFLARSMLTIFGGYAGDGKSTICAALAAVFSTGGLLPDGTTAPRLNSLFLSAEEDPQYALKPRLELHRANHARIFTMRGTRAGDDDDTRWTNLKTDIPLIRAVVAAHDIGIIWIDPITSYLPGSDRNSEGDIRDGMSGLNQLMEETGVAVVGVAHVGKGDGQGRRAEQRLLGSTAIVALARAVWMMTNLPEEHQPEHDPDNPVDKHKVFGVVKANYSIPPRSLALTRPLDGPIKWLGPSPIPIAEAFTAKPERGEKTRSAEDWLAERLAGGAQPSTTVEAAAKDAGISGATLRRAKAALNVTAARDRDQWYWRLPPGQPVRVMEGAHGKADSGHLPEMSTLDKVSIEEGAHDERLSAFPENQGKPETSMTGSPDADDRPQGEGAHFPHMSKMSTFHNESAFLDSLDPLDRADVLDLADELRQGGLQAVAAWRRDLDQRNGEVSVRDRQLVEIAISMSDLELAS